MSAATCKTCPWCDLHLSGRYGQCRRHAPRFVVGDGDQSAYFPIVLDTDWCGEHPGRQPLLECAPGTVVVGEMVPTESDMRRIVDALEKMATCAAVKP